MERVDPDEKMNFSSGPPPEFLIVECGIGFGGKYQLVADVTANGYPVWKLEDWVQDCYIFTGKSKTWILGDKEERNQNFECDTGHLAMMGDHGGRYPHHLGKATWVRFDQYAGTWFPEPSFKIMTPEKFERNKADKKNKGSAGPTGESGEAAAGEEGGDGSPIPSESCHKCHTVFEDKETLYCTKCKAPRKVYPGKCSAPCGAVYAPDATFCKVCGKARKQTTMPKLKKKLEKEQEACVVS
jgi:hypothetical protein